MTNMICKAMTKHGMPCKRLVVVGSKRCSLHGAYNTGPRSLIGRLRNSATLKLYRINGPGKGHKKGQKAALRRAARIAREKALPARLERKRLRQERWRMRKLIASGLPLITLAQSDD